MDGYIDLYEALAIPGRTLLDHYSRGGLGANEESGQHQGNGVKSWWDSISTLALGGLFTVYSVYL
jgi:hypothetical protein